MHCSTSSLIFESLLLFLPGDRDYFKCFERYAEIELKLSTYSLQ